MVPELSTRRKDGPRTFDANGSAQRNDVERRKRNLRKSRSATHWLNRVTEKEKAHHAVGAHRRVSVGKRRKRSMNRSERWKWLGGGRRFIHTSGRGRGVSGQGLGPRTRKSPVQNVREPTIGKAPQQCNSVLTLRPDGGSTKKSGEGMGFAY